jgi:hypothetical protein
MSIRSKCMGLASLLLLASWCMAPAMAQIAPYGAGQPYGFAGGAIAPQGAFGVGVMGPGPGAGLYGGAVNPYMAMGAGYGAGVSNPYNSYNANSQNGYNPFSYPYYGNGDGGIFGRWGGALYGASQVISAYGQALNAQEQSRLVREQYYQSQIETQRRRFDLAMYIRARTPTFTEEQANISRTTLKRIQMMAAPAEIANGKALNLLLDDASKFAGRRPALDPITLAPEVLRQLNVSKQGNGGIGLLRNDGKLDWPIALAEVTTPEQRKKMSMQAQDVIKDAAKGTLDANAFKDLRNDITSTRDQLLRRVNDLPGEQYMQAKRFLTEFENSLTAVQQGEAKVQADFDNFIGGKGHTVQEVVDFMTTSGYRFAPGIQGDEAGYRALYSALVNFDVALNSQYNSEPPPKAEAP